MDIYDYLNIMTLENASDLYLSTDAPPTIRVSGKLQAIDTVPLAPGVTRNIAYAIMSPEQAASFEIAPEMNLAIATDNERFRVNIFKQRGEVGLVLRSIKLIIPTMESLGLPVKVLQNLVMLKRGLVLFVGATSSGKSTSLASMIDYRNSNSAAHIITIEDPMEFVHRHKKCIVEQREVGFDTNSYEEALQNTLRQAPDVILIGEIRSQETMEHAIAFAETGHLCLSTLHANNANQAIARILSFFPQERHTRVLLELSLNMRGIISQRLISGLQGGMIPAVEILLDSPLVKELIKKGELREIKDVMQKSELIGMQTFDSALYKLFKAGKISYDDALANADSANDLRLRISLEEDLGGEQTAVSEEPPAAADSPANKTVEMKSAAIEKIKKNIAGISIKKDDDEQDDENGVFRR